MPDTDWVIDALRLTGGEPANQVVWGETDGRLRLWVLCSDVFAWGCADAEEITEERLPVLAQARVDLAAVGDTEGDELTDLFAARVRQMRPQGAWYKYVAPERWPLFNACGPHREAELGNPVATPETAQEQR